MEKYTDDPALHEVDGNLQSTTIRVGTGRALHWGETIMLRELRKENAEFLILIAISLSFHPHQQHNAKKERKREEGNVL